MECLATADCASSPNGKICSSGKCVACLADGDCAAGKYCGGGACLACVADSRCGASCLPCGGATPKCGGSSCVECVASADCAGNPAGNVCAGNKCVSCGSDADCGSGRYCSASTCLACTTDARCGASCGPCSGASPRCGGAACVECLGNADCTASAAGKFCTANRCVACAADTDCPAGNYCSASSCASCAVDAHCGSTCAACSGAAPRCGGSACVECVANADCATSPKGKLCSANLCVACLADADCGAGASCCKNACLSGKPVLSGVQRPSVYVGMAGNATLVGSNFNACSTATLTRSGTTIGTPVIPGYLSPTQLSLTSLPALAVGTYAVTVTNPGPGGGKSGPDLIDLWSNSVDFFDDPNAITYDGSLDATVVGTSTGRRIITVDGTTGTLRSSYLHTRYAYGLASNQAGKVLFLEDCCNSGGVYNLAAPTTTPLKLTLPGNGSSMAIDLAGGQAAIPYKSNYLYVDLATFSVGAARPGPQGVNLSGSAFFLGAAGHHLLMTGTAPLTMVDYPVASTTAAWTQPTGLPTANSPGIAVDSARGRVYWLGTNGIQQRDVSSGALLATLSTGRLSSWMVVNEGAGVAAAALDGDLAGSLAVLDLLQSPPEIAGVIGKRHNVGCGGGWNNSAGGGLAIDPLRNRVFLTSSCDGTVEAESLNVLFVKYRKPVITSVSPTTKPYATAFTLTITGTDFFPGSTTVTFAGAALIPTSITSTQIVVNVSAQSCGGNKAVAVTNPTAGGGGGTATAIVAVTMPTPVAIGVTPTACSYTLACSEDVAGSGFVPGCSTITASGASLGTVTSATTGTTTKLTFTLRAVLAAETETLYVTNPGAPASSTTMSVTR